MPRGIPCFTLGVFLFNVDVYVAQVHHAPSTPVLQEEKNSTSPKCGKKTVTKYNQSEEVE